MKSEIPIVVPQKFAPGDQITASWANQISSSIQRLAARNQLFGNRPQFFQVLPLQPYELNNADGTVKVKTGLVTTFDPIGFASPTLFEPTNVDTEIDITDVDTLYCKVTTDKNDVVTAAEIIAAASVTDTHAQPDPGGTVGTYHYKLADFETVDGVLKVKTTYHVGGNIIHRPGRNNRNLKITIQQRRVVYNECPPGVSLETVSSDEYIYYRKGLYVGVTDPGLESGETETERIVTRLHV